MIDWSDKRTANQMIEDIRQAADDIRNNARNRSGMLSQIAGIKLITDDTMFENKRGHQKKRIAKKWAKKYGVRPCCNVIYKKEKGIDSIMGHSVVIGAIIRMIKSMEAAGIDVKSHDIYMGKNIGMKRILHTVPQKLDIIGTYV